MRVWNLIPAISLGGITLAALIWGACGAITAPVSVPEAFTHNGTIGLKGTIADDQGQPVDQVIVKVDRTYYLWHVEGSYNEYSNFMIAADHVFDIKPMRANTLAFTFSKTGFSDQLITVDQNGAISNDCTCAIHGSKWAGQDVRVVLQKTDRPAPQLLTLEVTVDFTDPDKMPVIDLSAAHRLDTRVRTTYGGVRVLDLPQETLAPGALYAVVQRQALRTIGPDRRVDPLNVNMPERLTLRFSDTDGGFVRFTPSPGSGIFEQMGMAPDAGYENDLVLDAARLRKMRDPSNELVLDRNEFFYFRAGGKYGKAIVNWAADSGEALKLSFTILLQPDGTRNVESEGSH